MLPGVDGRSPINRGIVPGLRAGAVPHAIEFFDWTRGFLHMLGNLRDRRLHDEQSERVAERIRRYRHGNPRASLWLIGHSGGAALSLLALARLRGVAATGAVLLAPAISADYDVEKPLANTERGIWNFRSRGDLVLGLTLLMGNVDGPRSLSAGVRGFARGTSGPGAPTLHDVPWSPAMLRDAHGGGHFGCVNRRFIRRWVAPILLGRRCGID